LLFGLSEAAVVAAAFAAETSRTALFLAATAGNVLGALVNFALGRFLIRFEDRRWFPVSAAARQKAETFFARHGQPVLLFSWLPIIGDPLTLAAGLLRTPLIVFLAFVTIGKAARYAVILWLTP
jgi:membrane protein YqaA with SNARE-associated domain